MGSVFDLASGATLDLSGFSATIGGLKNNGRVVLGGGAALTVAQDGNSTYGGVVSGNGRLIKQGNGVLTLTGANSYSGGTVVEGGTLRAGAANAFIQNANYTINGGTLDLNGHALTMSALSGTGGTVALGTVDLTVDQTRDTDYAGTLSGAGRLIKAGSGTLTLTGASTLTNDAEIHGGTLGIAGGSLVLATALSVQGDLAQTAVLRITDGGTLVSTNGYIGNSANSSAQVEISGLGSVWTNGVEVAVGRQGTGTLTVSNGATVSGNTATIGQQDNSVGFATVTGAGSRWTNTAAMVVGDSGSGTLTIENGGMVSAPDIVVGGSALGDGRLALASGGVLETSQVRSAAGTGAVTLGDAALGGGVLRLTADQNALFDGVSNVLVAGTGNAIDTQHFSVGTETLFNGTGTLIKQGSGTLTLTGNSNAFAGTTSVTGGTLIVGAGGAGQLGGAVQVAHGGRLSGSGTIGGSVSVADGGTLAPGNSPGTLTINGDLVLASGSVLAFELGEAGTVGGALNDHLLVGGDLTLGGTLDVAVPMGGTFGTGVYRLISYDGTLTDNGLTLGLMPAGSMVNLQTAVRGQVNLVNTAGLTLRYWDGTTGLNNNAIDGGTGIWRAGSSSAWTEANGGVNGGYNDGSFAVFGGSGGTVTLDASDGALRASGLQFLSDGYVLTGDALTLTGPAATVRVGDGTAHGAGFVTTLQAALTGATQLIKADLGTLVLAGANSYTGGTVVAGGTLRAGAANAFIQNGSYTVNDGTLDLNGHALTMSALSGTGGTVALGGASLTVAQSTDTAYAGRLTGTGSFTKTGAGVLTLTGANSYTGDTVVAGGTLRAGAANTFIQNGSYTVNDGTLDLNGHALTMSALSGTGGTVALGGASLTLALTADTTFAGSFSGAGTLIKQGGSALILTGDNSGFTGTLRLAGGHMVVGRGGTASLGGTVELAAGGRLSGSGTVGSAVVGDKATIAPGNSIGTLTVNGNLTIGAGSLYEVEVDPAGSASDRVHVTGMVQLKGGTVLHLGEEGAYEPFARYTILTADGGIKGTFRDAQSQFAFLTPVLSYTTHEVALELTRNEAMFGDKAVTRNQRAVAGAAERLGTGHAVYDAILLLPDDAARVQHSFDLLSGEVHASARTVLIEDSRFVREAVSQQLRGATGGGLWAQTFGGWSRRSADGNAARLTHNTQGILLGWDVALGAGSAGVIAGYGNADLTVSQRASSGEAESYHLGVYWGTRLGNVSLRGGAAYSRHDLETRRDVTVAALSQDLRAAYKGTSVQAFGEAAWAVPLGRVTLEPFAGLAHVVNTVDDFRETGGTAALSGGGDDLAATFGTLGLNARLGFAVGNLPAALHGSFGWQHAFGDKTPTSRHGFSDSDPFAVTGSPLAQDVARIQTGFQLDVSTQASLGLGYSGQYAGGVEKHDLSARFSVRF